MTWLRFASALSLLSMMTWLLCREAVLDFLVPDFPRFTIVLRYDHTVNHAQNTVREPAGHGCVGYH